MERHWTLYFARSVRKVVRLKWQIPPSLAQQTICIFLMVSNQREHFSYSLFYFGCKYKEVKPLKFSNPHIWRAFWVPLLAFLSQLLSTLIFSALCDKRVFHTIFFYKSLSLSPQKMGTTSRTQRFIQWHKQTWKEI